MNSPDQSSKRRNLAVVAVILNDDGKALLTQRNQPNSHAHKKWQFAGGGIEHGEHPINALKREIQEEVGNITYTVLSDAPFLISDYRIEHDVHTIVLGFPIRFLSGDIDISHDEETGNFGWFTFEEIKQLDSQSGTVELVERALTYI